MEKLEMKAPLGIWTSNKAIWEFGEVFMSRTSMLVSARRDVMMELTLYLYRVTGSCNSCVRQRHSCWGARYFPSVFLTPYSPNTPEEKVEHFSAAAFVPSCQGCHRDGRGGPGSSEGGKDAETFHQTHTRQVYRVQEVWHLPCMRLT